MAGILELQARDRVKAALGYVNHYLGKGDYAEVRKLLDEARNHLKAAENHKKAER